MATVRHGSIALLVCAFTAVLTTTALGHPTGGDTDVTFGTGSPAAARHACGAGASSGVADAARQADGEIVLAGAGRATSGGRSAFCMLRIEGDGRLDPGFGDGDPDTAWSGDGETAIEFGPDVDATASAVAIQSDGRAVVAGGLTEPGGAGRTRLAVTRLDTDGTLDTTFGDDGRVVIDALDSAADVLVQPDGRIVLVTTVTEGPATRMALARLTAAGALDPSFGGGDGVARAPVFSQGDRADDVALQADGKILASGTASSPFRFAAAVRFNTDGSLDTSFGGDGAAYAGSTVALDTAVLPGPGGSVTVVSERFISGTRVPPSGDFQIARLTPAGRLDRSFAPNGIRTHYVGAAVNVRDVAPAEDGGMTVVGSFTSGLARLTSSYFVAKTLPNGMLDRNFARHAVTFGAPVEATAMAVVPTGGGRVLVAGPASSPFTAVQLLGPRVRTLRCRGEQSGSSGRDFDLRGTPSADAIFGKGDADEIAGLGGGDCLNGGSGGDVISGGAGNDIINGDSGADVIRAGSGRNVVRGGAGADRINTRNGRRDVVNCGTGRDRATVDRADRVRGCEVVSRG